MRKMEARAEQAGLKVEDTGTSYFFFPTAAQPCSLALKGSHHSSPLPLSTYHLGENFITVNELMLVHHYCPEFPLPPFSFWHHPAVLSTFSWFCTQEFLLAVPGACYWMPRIEPGSVAFNTKCPMYYHSGPQSPVECLD